MAIHYTAIHNNINIYLYIYIFLKQYEKSTLKNVNNIIWSLSILFKNSKKSEFE